MPTFSGGYIEPGVYVQVQDVSIPNVPPGALVGAITGIGIPTKTIFNEKLVMTGSPFTGTLSTFPVVSVASDATGEYVVDQTGTKFYQTDDWTIDLPTGTITWAAVPVNGQPVNGTIFVTYTVDKTALDKGPKLYSSLQQVQQAYGLADPDNDGVVENTIPLGAQVFFENGGGLLMVVQIGSDISTDDTLVNHEAGIDLLKNVDVYCVVPLLATNSVTNTGLIAYMSTHVTNQSSTTERHERIGILGGPVGSDNPSDTETSVTGYVSTIDPINNARIAYVVPSEATKALPAGEVTVGGPYLACAVAGIVCNPTTTAGEPISGKVLAGFDTIQDIYTRAQKNRIASYGALIVENNSGVFSVRHALSTDPSSVVTVELKITRIKDYIARTMRTALGAQFINTRFLGTETIAAITTSARLILDGVVALRDIVSYVNLQVTQDLIDPRQIDVTFQIRPSFDVNYILVTFGVTFP